MDKSKIRILLVEAFEVGENPLVSDWIMQPLGLLYLGGALKSSGYENVRILDTKLYPDPMAELNGVIDSFKPDVVGFRCLSASAAFFHTLIAEVKRKHSDIVTIAGGPHANARAPELMKDANLDYIVLNEGEITLPELLDTHFSKGDLSKVQGILYKENGEIRQTPFRAFFENPDDIPFPAWELTDTSLYRERFLDDHPGRLNYVQLRQDAMPLFTSRACPYGCIYCHKIFGKKFRAHSPERVLKEIDILYEKHNIRQFDFYDDIFNLDRNRTETILKGIAARKKEGRDIKLSFFNGIRGDIQDPLLVKDFRDAGTFMIPYAVETASPRLQKLIKKNINLEKLRRIVSFTSRLNIITVGFAMLGFPTETREEIDMTIEYMLSADFDMVEFFIVSPYFGTELAEMIKSHYPEIQNDSSEVFHYMKARYSLAGVSPEELEEIHGKAYYRILTDKTRISKLETKIRIHRKS
ncbi:MAG: B12-binding domain-containing radical SAM protein [Firmicutes bacterium]|nr:B12-binding domain-containing radical SAM protein [Bacillota bacterium]